MTQTKMKTFLGVDIFVNSENGRFHAEIEGKTHTAGSMKSLETQIRKTRQGVQVIVLGSAFSGRSLPHNPAIEKVIRVDKFSLHGPRDARIWGEAFVYDEGLFGVLQTVYSEYKEAMNEFEDRWMERWENARSELTRVDHKKLAEMLRLTEQQTPAE